MDQIHCTQVKALLVATPEQGAELPPSLQDHVHSCDSCRLELAAAGALVRLVGDFGAPLEPDSTPEQMAARAVLAASPGQPSSGRSRLGALARVGAAAALAAGLTWAVMSGFFGDGSSEGQDGDLSAASSPHSASSAESIVTGAPGTDSADTEDSSVGAITILRCRLLASGEPCRREGLNISTGPHDRARVSLSDGTTVTLNYQSQLSVPPDRARAIVLASGEAHVEVVRQAGLPPLAVALPNGRVDVVGTTLTLRALPKFSVVSVVTGKVKAHGGGTVQGVGAGEQAVMVGDTAPVVSTAPNLALAADWARERPKGGVADDGASTTGFGTLRARKPGAKKDNEGRPLRLADHRVKVDIQGVVARTEVTEVFANDTDSVLEGVYSFPLPPGAQIAGLDLEVEGRWEHGAIVDRERGDKIWRGVIRNATPKSKAKRAPRREWIWVPGPWKDPALMQWKQGSRFELRIFPIPARGSRRVRITYTTPMTRVPGGRRYVMPLAGRPDGSASADRFAMVVNVGGGAQANEVRMGGYPMIAKASSPVSRGFEAEDFKPRGALVVDVAEPAEQATAEVLHTAYRDAASGEAFAMFNLRPALATRVDSASDLRVVVVVDRSYSTQQARLERSGVVVEDIIERLGERSQVMVLGCSARCEALSEGWVNGSGSSGTLGRKVAALEPLGASNVSAMLRAAGEALRDRPQGTRGRVILISDGVATSGEVETQRLAAVAKAALGKGRLTTVALGGEVDAPVLRALADAVGGAFVEHRPGATLAATAWEVGARQLQVPVRDLRVKLPAGTRDVVGVPSVLWPGQELVVTAKVGSSAEPMDRLEGEVRVSGRLDGQAWERRVAIQGDVRSARGNAFLPRMWAQARISELEKREDAASRRAVVALSKKHHVLSRHTSLIVLESAAMARAFKVDDTRPAVDWDGTADVDVVASAPEATAGTLAGGLGTGGGGLTRGRYKQSLKNKKADSKGLADDFAKRTAAARPAKRPWSKDAAMGRAQRRRTGGWWQRTVWYRVAKVRPARETASAYEARQLAARQARLRESPDSRERTRALVRWHVRLGQVEAARELVERWLAKDRMDVDALRSLADIEALDGNLRRSEDLLASIVDVDRTATQAHSRLYELYAAAGMSELACDQAIARALLAEAHKEHAAAAMRCARVAESQRFLSRLDSARDRAKALKLAAATPSTPKARGKLKVSAQWLGGGQVDVVVVTPKGQVVSWRGGAPKTTSVGARSITAESLGLRAREVGRYRVYVVRPETAVDPGTVSGTVSARSYDSRRRAEFTLRPGQRAHLLDVDIQRKSRVERRQRGTARP